MKEKFNESWADGKTVTGLSVSKFFFETLRTDDDEKRVNWGKIKIRKREKAENFFLKILSLLSEEVLVWYVENKKLNIKLGKWSICRKVAVCCKANWEVKTILLYLPTVLCLYVDPKKWTSLIM